MSNAINSAAAFKLSPIDRFDGSFEFLPFVAHVELGPVPLYPVDGDFEHAVSQAFGENATPAAIWRKEAVRWRRQTGNGGKPLDMKAIALATAADLHKRMGR